MTGDEIGRVLAKMFTVMAGEYRDGDTEAAVLDLYNDVVKMMPTSAVAGLRALCTAELHERGEDT
jgi:hypothetical protein